MIKNATLKDGRALTLRNALSEDAEAILVYIKRTAGESDNLSFGADEFELSVEQEREVLLEMTGNAGHLYLIAEVEGEIAGTLSFQSGKRPRTRHVGEFGISVARKFWGMGIGGYLLGYLIDWAKQSGFIRKINLHTRVDNVSAIHLYEKYGFVHEGGVARQLYVGGEFVDAYIMGLLIDPE